MTTLRRRRDEWIDAGLMDELQAVVLRACDRMIELELGYVAVDGYITKVPGGGEPAGKSPVDRGKQVLKRSSPPRTGMIRPCCGRRSICGTASARFRIR